MVVVVVMAAVAALATTVLSVLAGVAVASRARASVTYTFALALLFLPFAIGSSVWGYSVSRLFVWTGLQQDVVSGTTFLRASVLLLLCLLRTVPLGAFFVATLLQKHAADIRGYAQIHKLRFRFFMQVGLSRIPRSTLILLGLFGGAMLASESSLPTFLYRANPGTGPETVNLMLNRTFREIYAISGPNAIERVASLGAVLSMVMLLSSMVGAWLGRFVLRGIKGILMAKGNWARHLGSTVAVAAWGMAIVSLVPGFGVIVAQFSPDRADSVTMYSVIDVVGSYWKIGVLGILVGVVITFGSVALAIRLRYSSIDRLSVVERSVAAACLLMLPLFIPVLSVIAILGALTKGELVGATGYLAFLIGQIVLHYSLFQFICIGVVSTIPDRYVLWERSVGMKYLFSFVVDGVRRHKAVVVALTGLGLVLVFTDGTVTRWFDHLVNSPEESLYAAVFGRLSNASRAAVIAWSVIVGAVIISTSLSAAYAADIRTRGRNV